ncbi:MAG: hypothetical protein ACRDE2_06320 [Chitinophagaceae bacterium]
MQDIMLSNTYDLNVANGDFAIGESIEQHQQLLLLTNPGEWKENPEAGIGVSNYLLDETPADLKRAIRMGFNADGMTVDQITVDVTGIIGISANY